MVFNNRSNICFGLLLAFCTIFGLSLSDYSDVNAWVDNPRLTYYTKIHTTSLGSNGFVGYQDTVSPPVNILSRPASGNNYLVGLALSGLDVSSFSYSSYTVFYLDFQLRVFNGNNTFTYFSNVPAPDTSMSVLDGQRYTSGTCSISTYQTNVYYQYSCAVSLPKDARPSQLYLSVGDPTATSSPYTPIAGINYASPSGTILKLNYVGYGYDTSQDETAAYLGVLSEQNKTIIEQNNTIINNNQQYYDANYEAVDNISNQSSSDIPNATSTQTTNLIGLISSFFSSLRNINTTSCDLTLPFPDFAGGSVVVNPCDGKQYAPDFVNWVATLFLLMFTIPVCFLLLRMIFFEIRSWTRG